MFDSFLINRFSGACISAVFMICVSVLQAESSLDISAMIHPIPGRVIIEGDQVKFDSPAILRDDKHHVWGASVIQGDDGRYHMFYSIIDGGPHARRFSDSWLFTSKIAYAVSDKPDRDFKYQKIILTGQVLQGKPDAWDAQSAHNPHIRRFDGKYYLYYVSSKDPGAQPVGSPGEKVTPRNRIQQNQKIGVVVANSIKDLVNGNFKRSEQPLLTPRTRVKANLVVNPSPKGTKAKPDNMIVVNPAVIRRPSDGKYLLYFKGNLWNPGWRGVHGIAIGDSPTGPFQPLDKFVFNITMPDGRIASAEDPYVWYDAKRKRFFAVLKDFTGRLTRKGPALALLESDNGIDWLLPDKPLASLKQLTFEDGNTVKVHRLERPQLLFDNKGQLVALYAACIVGNQYKHLHFNVHIPLESSKE